MYWKCCTCQIFRAFHDLIFLLFPIFFLINIFHFYFFLIEQGLLFFCCLLPDLTLADVCFIFTVRAMTGYRHFSVKDSFFALKTSEC